MPTRQLTIYKQSGRQRLTLDFENGTTADMSYSQASKTAAEAQMQKVIRLVCPLGSSGCEATVSLEVNRNRTSCTAAAVDCSTQNCPLDRPPDSGDREPRQPHDPVLSPAIAVPLPAP